MALKKCPKCEDEFNGSRSLKEHMTDVHGGFNSGDIPNDTSNQAKAMMGSNSLAEVTGKAPTDEAAETAEGEAGSPQQASPTRGRPKKTNEEQKAQERKKVAMQRIGGVICRKAASLPYAFWSSLAANDSLRLNRDEQKELADAYLEIAQGYDMDFSSPFMGIMAAMAINAEFVAKRMGIDLTDETSSN